jgi:hypothetical protein
MQGDSGLQRIFMQLDSWADKHDASSRSPMLPTMRSAVSRPAVFSGNSPADYVDIAAFSDQRARPL